MTETILVPLDGSRTSHAVLPVVARLIGALPGTVVLVSVVQLEAVGFGDVPGVTGISQADLSARLVEASRRYLQGHAAQLARPGLELRCEVELGSPASAILELAERNQATLIAMATHGYTGLTRFMFGSTAERVLREAGCPVLLVRPQEDAPAQTGPIKTILLPTDGSPRALGAIRAVASWAKRLGAAVEVLHVVEPSLPGVDPPADATPPEQAVQAACAALQAEGVTGIPHLREGDAARTIIDQARTADLVAMSSHGRSGLGRTLLGSVSEAVARGCGKPVLVVRNR